MAAVISDLAHLAQEPSRSAAPLRPPIVKRFDATEIVQRAMLALVNEAACILADGVAVRPSDIDLVMVCAYGFPAWEGRSSFFAARPTGSG
jgi:3-hydroxyacyl-CoA dehydrogenase